MDEQCKVFIRTVKFVSLQELDGAVVQGNWHFLSCAIVFLRAPDVYRHRATLGLRHETHKRVKATNGLCHIPVFPCCAFLLLSM